MITHFIKLIWKKRKKNFLLMVEIFVSFMVLFAIFSLMIYNYGNYMQDRGLNSRDAWVINFRWPDSDKNISREKLQILRELILSKKEVECASFSANNYPYSFSTWSTEENNVRLNFVGGDPGYFKVLQVPFTEGKGFTSDDRMLKKKPVVINRKAAGIFFPGQPATGKVFGTDSNLVVTGVVEKFRASSSFAEDEPTIFHLYDIADSSAKYLDNLLIRVRPGTGRAFESGLMKEIAQLTPGWDVELQWLDELRKTKDTMSMGMIWILIIVAAFLILNVILGLFGLLWYNINHRKAEIGLRRALGATKREITRHFIRETMVMTTFATVIGLIFAIQFPIMQVFEIKPVIYILAIIVSLIFLYGLILLSSLVPSRRAAEVEPATALYEE